MFYVYDATKGSVTVLMAGSLRGS